MNHLEKIIAHKREEVKDIANKAFPLIELRNKNIPSLYETLRQQRTLGVIAEIKKASPSKGELNINVNVVEQAKCYEANGASAISVLTDEKFFKGTMEDLIAVRQVVNIPILCKDFIVSKEQITVAHRAGANIILLIVGALTDEELLDFQTYAESLNLEVLVEVHDEEELKRSLKLRPKLLGVNNRDLTTFSENLDTTKRLAELVENEDCILVSESGIRHVENAETVTKYGAKCVLVGEAFMRAENPGELLGAFRKIETIG